jgi:hypothetical protein
LGRFDIAYATLAMSRVNILLTRVGHLKAVNTILSLLKTFPKGIVIIDTSYPDHNMYPVEDLSNWMEFYPDASEEIPKDLPSEKGPRVRMTVYFLVLFSLCFLIVISHCMYHLFYSYSRVCHKERTQELYGYG